MTTNNSVNTTLSGQTGTANFVGSTSPTITTPVISGAILAPTAIQSGAGVNVLTFGYTTSAVNYFTITNQITNTPPTLDVTGSDSAVNMNLRTKNGDFLFSDTTGTKAPILKHFNAAGTHYIGLRAGTSISGDATFVLPSADGAAGTAMKTDGSGNLGFTTNKPLTQIGVQVFTSTGANTYTPTAGTTLAFVELWGAGGGGGSSNSATIYGNGGGAGAYSASWVSNPTTVTISIGTGGNGGVKNNGTAGTDGGDTTYNTTTIVAKGGVHAANGANAGGAGGSAASGTGDIKLSGGQGNSNPNATAGFIPGGGSSPKNLPIPALAQGSAAAAANSGGGGAAGNSTTDAVGGYSGYAVVTEFRSV